MSLKNEILSYLRKHKTEFEIEYSVVKLGLFGSIAEGNDHNESDIDIILDFAPNTESIYQKKMSIRKALQERFGRNVDICTEKFLKPYFKENILKTTTYV